MFFIFVYNCANEQKNKTDFKSRGIPNAAKRKLFYKTLFAAVHLYLSARFHTKTTCSTFRVTLIFCLRFSFGLAYYLGNNYGKPSWLISVRTEPPVQKWYRCLVGGAGSWKLLPGKFVHDNHYLRTMQWWVVLMKSSYQFGFNDQFPQHHKNKIIIIILVTVPEYDLFCLVQDEIPGLSVSFLG